MDMSLSELWVNQVKNPLLDLSPDICVSAANLLFHFSRRREQKEEILH